MQSLVIYHCKETDVFKLQYRNEGHKEKKKNLRQSSDETIHTQMKIEHSAVVCYRTTVIIKTTTMTH